MATIIFGKQNIMVKRRLKKIVADIFQNEEENVVVFDGCENSLDEIVLDCNQLSLMCEKKVVEVFNPYYLTNEKINKKSSVDNDESKMLEYLKDENSDTTLIFVLNASSLNQRNKIVKYIQEHGNIFELKDLSKDDWPLYVKKYFEKKGINITQEAIDEIVLRSQNDLNIFTNEVDKLLLYKQNDITIDDVNKVMTKPLENDAFEFANTLLLDEKEETYKIYKDLRITSGIEPINLINLVTSSLVFYDLVSTLDMDGYSESMIASKIDANPYRVKMVLKNIRQIDRKKIRRALNNLHELDKKIKHNEVDRFYAFEMFILNF